MHPDTSIEPGTEDIEALRARTRAVLRSGDLVAAAALQASLLARLEAAGAVPVDDLMHSALIAFNRQDTTAAYHFMTRARDAQPDNPLILWNLAQILVVAGRFEAALAQAEVALGADPDYFEAHAVLARIHHALGHRAEAREHGEQALLDADRRAMGTAAHLPPGPPPPFDAGAPQRNVIAMSLWGDAPRYLDNALANARLAPDIYPGWRLRIYCEASTVPTATQHALRDLGCDVRAMPPQRQLYEGLFWRMLVCAEAGVARFLMRDADSIFSARERAAVDEWLVSERYFHVMRDHAMQTDPIQAGLWGGVGGMLPPLPTLLARFTLRQAPTRMVDQVFLAHWVWPTVRQSVLVHDSLYRCFGARLFPTTEAPPGGYLGAPAPIPADA